MVFAYSLESAAVPFPAFVFAYFFNGYGSAHLVSDNTPGVTIYEAYFLLECRHQRLPRQPQRWYGFHPDGHPPC